MTDYAIKLLKMAYEIPEAVSTSDISADLETALNFLNDNGYITIEKRYIQGALFSITQKGKDYINRLNQL